MPYHVYILSNRTKVLYVGVTGNLRARMARHRAHKGAAFARRYNVDRLVFLERYSDRATAYARENQIKGWSRRKKIAFIDGQNPMWRDLSDEL